MKSKTTKNKITLETIADSIGRLDIGLKKLDTKLSKRIDNLETSLDQKIDDLALATANGFRDVEKRLSNRIDGVEENLNSKIKSVEKTLSAQIVGLDNKIDDLNFHKVGDEVYVLTQRIMKVETKVGVKV